jgi:hypothetical protein
LVSRTKEPTFRMTRTYSYEYKTKGLGIYNHAGGAKYVQGNYFPTKQFVK